VSILPLRGTHDTCASLLPVRLCVKPTGSTLADKIPQKLAKPLAIGQEQNALK
jgi:hypothetical protein